MASNVTYSSTSSFYYIEFYVDGSLNKELMSNFKKVRIENNISNIYPVINIEFYIDNQAFIDNNIYPQRNLSMYLYYSNEDNTRIDEPLIFDLIILEMQVELPPKVYNNVSNKRDNQRRTMMMTCVSKPSFELMNTTVNKMWTEPTTVRNIVIDLCTSIGVSSEHFEPSKANNSLISQCIIPPMTFRAALDYLDATYGIYEGKTFRYANYNGTLEMWDLKTKFDSMKSNAVYKIHKLPVYSDSDAMFKRPAELAQEYADHYISYDSMSTIIRSNDAFIPNGFRQVHVFHPYGDIAEYVNVDMRDIAKSYGMNSDYFNLKVNENVLTKRLKVHYDSIGGIPTYDDDPIMGYLHNIAANQTGVTLGLNAIRFYIYRKIKFHLLMRIGMPMYLQPYSEHELYAGSNYSGAYLITKSVCTVSREGANGNPVGDQMNASASVVAVRTSQSQDQVK